VAGRIPPVDHRDTGTLRNPYSVEVPRTACRYVRHLRSALLCSAACTVAGDVTVIVANDASPNPVRTRGRDMLALGITEPRGRSSAPGTGASRGRAHQARNIPPAAVGAGAGSSPSTQRTIFTAYLSTSCIRACLCGGSISNSPSLRRYTLTQKIHT
jgi:hypothetical protein